MLTQELKPNHLGITPYHRPEYGRVRIETELPPKVYIFIMNEDQLNLYEKTNEIYFLYEAKGPIVDFEFRMDYYKWYLAILNISDETNTVNVKVTTQIRNTLYEHPYDILKF